MQNPVFVDWLSMHQVHYGEKLPVVNQGQVFSLDEDGQIEWTTQRHMVLEGSYNSKLMLRCDGSSVHVSGNVGRWHRTDNLFGFSYQQCVRKWNSILNDFNLPPFTAGELVFIEGQNHFGFTGAVNTRIDITKNYTFFNRDDLAFFMQWLSTHQKGRLKVGVSGDGSTVHWGEGSKYIYEKFYDKFLEMQAHGKRKNTVPQEVKDFVFDNGVGRHEITLKSRYLTQNGLKFMGATDMDTLTQIYRERSQLVLKQSLPWNDFNDIPMPYRATAKDWRDGVPVVQTMKKATFYRHRVALKHYGIDIATPCNVRALPVRFREINYAALIAPEWYRKKYG